MELYVRLSSQMVRNVLVSVLTERDERKVMRRFNDELERYYQGLNRAYREVYGKDLITVDLKDRKNIERLFKSGGL